jgi:hypothetical protein
MTSVAMNALGMNGTSSIWIWIAISPIREEPWKQETGVSGGCTHVELNNK